MSFPLCASAQVAELPWAASADQDRLPLVELTVYQLLKGTSVQNSSNGEDTVEHFGLCAPVKITLGGAAPGEIRIGVFESTVGGIAKDWKTAAWQASLAAAQILDFHPLCMQASFSLDGRIGGASAGGVLTIGVMAGVLGHEVRDDIAMTGTINPDGMIGPVGGIALKLEGAARIGKTTVLIPVHDRLEVDPRTEELVDLVEVGKKLGIEVIPVNDVWTAYELFTGQPLPRPEAKRLPLIGLAASKHVKSKIPYWAKMYKKAKGIYEEWPERNHTEEADEYISEATISMDRAISLLQEGQFAPAYWDAVWGATMAWAAHEHGRYLDNYNKRGLQATFRLPKEDDWLTKEIDKTAAAMRFFRPRTLDQLAIYMAACDAFVDGLCFYQLSDTIRNNLPQDEEDAANWVFAAAEQQILAWIDMKLAIDYLELADEYQGMPIPEDAPVDLLHRFYMRSAEAGMAMVDELELGNVARRYNLTTEQAETELYLRDPYYANAKICMRKIIPNLSNYFGDNEQLQYAQLAVATTMHTRAAMLMAKYYSLQAELDENYDFVGLRRERALKEWLDDSADQAKRAITALGKDGIDQTTCLQIYSIAEIYEGRDLADRLEALEFYFSTNVTAQVLRKLAGKSTIEVKSAE